MEKDDLDFSFSGLKTAVLREVQERFGTSSRTDTPGSVHPLAPSSDDPNVRDVVSRIAAAFQEAVVDVLVVKGLRAAEKHRSDKLVVCGGVAANRSLRERMMREGRSRGIEPIFPSMNLCTDNAAMIAVRAEMLLTAGLADDLTFGAKSRW
jgi:N6-L-threonylcarbamoyladenine synthase